MSLKTDTQRFTPQPRASTSTLLLDPYTLSVSQAMYIAQLAIWMARQRRDAPEECGDTWGEELCQYVEDLTNGQEKANQ